MVSMNPVWNPIEKLRSIVKMKLSEGSKVYYSKADLWESFNDIMPNIKPEEVKTRIKSMDNRLLAVIEKRLYYIKM